MKTRFPAHFDSLIDKLKKYLPLKSADWIDGAGAHNLFARGTLANSFGDHDFDVPHLPVAITQAKSDEKAAISRAAIHLLHEKSNPTLSFDEKKSLPPLDLTFIHTPLYYGETVKISKLGHCDTYDYKYEHSIDIREWCAQLTLAVYELHLHNLVHLDIKPENIFLFLYPDRAHLKLGDLDELSIEDDPKIRVAGTAAQLAPEICYHWKTLSREAKQALWERQSDKYKIEFWHSLSSLRQNILWQKLSTLQQAKIYKKLTLPQQLLFLSRKKIFEQSDSHPKKELFWKELSDFNLINNKKFFKANKKALDCYALGATFSTILLQSCLFDSLLDDLIKGLMHKNPRKRLSIEQVRQHDFFGKTEEDRNIYFSTLKEKYKSETFIDGYYIPTQHVPKQHDTFYILPLKLKEIYLTALDLNFQINSIKQIPDEKYLRNDFTKLTFWKTQKVYEAPDTFRRQSHFIYHKINEYYADEYTLLAMQKKADTLKEQTESFLRNGKRLTIIKELRTAAEEIVYTIDELLIKYLSSINNERLFNAVLNAEKTCCIQNKILFEKILQPDMPSEILPARLNILAFKNINRFANEIQSMTKTHSTRQVFLHILAYLEADKGSHSSLFKTILTQELRSISQRPLHKWTKHLSPAVEKPVQMENCSFRCFR
jgi:serine/threonine protein kinase